MIVGWQRALGPPLSLAPAVTGALTHETRGTGRNLGCNLGVTCARSASTDQLPRRGSCWVGQHQRPGPCESAKPDHVVRSFGAPGTDTPALAIGRSPPTGPRHRREPGLHDPGLSSRCHAVPCARQTELPPHVWHSRRAGPDFCRWVVLKSVTISIRRISLGAGYRYLMKSVAVGDGAAARSSPLTRYYAESGTPPGRFLGAGLAGLDGGRGVDSGSEVSEKHLFRMLGMCADPLTGEPLGRRPGRQPAPLAERVATQVAALPDTLSEEERDAEVVRIEERERRRQTRLSRPVAGFDLTFSVPKSISAAWALADEGTKAVIYACHQDAIARTIAYAEAGVFHSRSGTDGIAQVDIAGVMAAEFDHWDSRAGDPQLHSHVAVSNRAQSISDGRWRTLDSRGLFKSVVALSELHEGILDDLLTGSLGWGFDSRTRKHSSVPKYEVTGVADALIAEFSTRSAAIEEEKEVLIDRFATTHGRQPTSVEVLRLRQQATLATRPEKIHRSLEEMSDQWRQRAGRYVGDDVISWVATLRDRNDLPLLRSADLSDDMLDDLGSVVLQVVAERRATFSRANLSAEVHRQLHGVRFASPDERVGTGERATNLAVASALMVSAPEVHHTPSRFSRPDGTSRFRGKGTQVYTTQSLLDAEGRLLEAGRKHSAPTVGRGVIAAVCDADLAGKSYPLSLDQAVAVEAVATSGRALDVLVGPAGTGKTSTMAGLRAAWEATYGAGSVVGLAPSAAAAEALADELGIGTENTAKWLTEIRRQPQRQAMIAELRSEIAALAPSVRRARLADRIAGLEVEMERWKLSAGQLVIIDEASLAGTFALDELVSLAAQAGAKTLLVGDWGQLSAVEAGGAFSLLVADRELAPELTDVRRFEASWEKAASIELRVGDESAITTYEMNDRIRDGNREEMLEELYLAWRADVEAGKRTLMIAGDLATVVALNEWARAARVAAGEVATSGLEVAGGAVAGEGDRVVTRENNRRLGIGRRWVRNGDQWVVIATNSDGSMALRRAAGGGQVVVPADYARHHIELGYASTAYRAQGATVDTAHAMVTVTTTREVLYVSATRGRESNSLYVDTAYDPDPDTSHREPEHQCATQVLASVLRNIGSDVAATAMIAHEQEVAGSMATLAAEYQTIAQAAQAERWDSLIARSGLSEAELANVRSSEAYGPLLAAFRAAEARGLDVENTFPQLVRGRGLAGANDSAAVLHGRVDRWIEASGSGRPPKDNLIAGIIPAAQRITDPDMALALEERAAAMAARARTLAEQAIEESVPWARPLGPVPVDPLRRDAWLTEVTTVAAYRDRWHVSGRPPVGDPEAGTIERLGQARRALRAAERAAVLAAQGQQRWSEPGLCQTVGSEQETPGV